MPTIPQGPEPHTHLKAKAYRLTGAFLGWLGAVNSLLIGAFIVNTAFALTRFPHSENLILQGGIAIVGTAFSSVGLTCGSYLLWREKPRQGGVTNCVSGATLALLYIDFRFLVEPSFLGWLDPVGYFLIAPALLSGFIGLLTSHG